MRVTPGAVPATRGRDAPPVCGRCPKCHPGRQFGGDEKCRVLPDVRPWVTCDCHKEKT